MTTKVSVDSALPDFLENISTGRHVFQADEPVGAGGGDAAHRLRTNCSLHHWEPAR